MSAVATNLTTRVSPNSDYLDPYYFLQFDLPESASPIASNSFAEQFAGTFPPSFLSMDVDGRVLRLDS